MEAIPALYIREDLLEKAEIDRICPDYYPTMPSRLEEYNRRVVALYLRDSACLSAGKNVYDGSTLAENCLSTIGLMECYSLGNREAYLRSLQYAIQQECKVIEVKTEYHGT